MKQYVPFNIETRSVSYIDDNIEEDPESIVMYDRETAYFIELLNLNEMLEDDEDDTEDDSEDKIRGSI